MPTDDEKVFLKEGGVTVTQARFIVTDQTYAMSGITSVRAQTHPPPRIFPIIVVILGALLALGSFSSGAVVSTIFGTVVLGAGVFWWIRQQPSHSIVLKSSSGESQALTSYDYNVISRAIDALNKAIVARG